MATHHIYRELKPDVFTNNRVSCTLDTLKPSAEIIAEYVAVSYSKQIVLNAVTFKAHITNTTIHSEFPPCMVICRLTRLRSYVTGSLVDLSLDEHFKSAAYLWETVTDPKTAKSGEPTESSFSRAVGNGAAFWDWAGRPEHAFNQRRFDIGMRGTQALITATSITTGTIYNHSDMQRLTGNRVRLEIASCQHIGSRCRWRRRNRISVPRQRVPPAEVCHSRSPARC